MCGYLPWNLTNKIHTFELYDEIYFPSNLYLIKNDDEIITNCVINYDITDYLRKYNPDCEINYRNYGYCRSLMIYVINDELQKGKNSFILEVDHDNFIAYKSLGFEPIGSNSLYHIFMLNF